MRNPIHKPPPQPPFPIAIARSFAHTTQTSSSSKPLSQKPLAKINNTHFPNKMEATWFSSSACLTGSLPLPPLCSQNLNQRSLFPLIGNQQLCSIGIKHQVTNFCAKAALRGNLEATGVPTSVPVRVAHELLQAGHKYLDVRTPEEFSAGHAPGAVNIPYMYRVGSGMTKNPHFMAEVLSHFRKEDEIIVGCLSGKRSMMAAADLLAAGFSCITDIAGGYAAWTQSSLPTEL